jgi:RimJ/RimL family protein N-acetyltransferase
MKLLKSKIKLLKFTIKDISEKYISWLKDPLIIRFTRIKKTKIEQIINYVIKNTKSKNVIFLKILFNNIHIGNIRLFIQRKKISIAIILGDRKYHGKGIGTEVVKKLVKKIKKMKKITKIESFINKSNYPSIAIFEKNGFVKDNVVYGKWILNIK